MPLIDDIIDAVELKEKEIQGYFYNDHLEEIDERLKNINFLAEIDHQEVYIFQLIQIKSKQDDEVKLLDIDESNEFYISKTLSGFDNYKAYQGLAYRFSLDKDYIRVIAVKNPDIQKSPKDIYGEAFEKYVPSKVNLSPEPGRVVDIVLNSPEEPPLKETWLKLKKIFTFSKTTKIEIADFEKKVYDDISRYFGEINKTLINDEYKETLLPEIVYVPSNFRRVTVDSQTQRVVQGISYDSINFDSKQGHIRAFSNATDALYYAYSTVEWINKGNFDNFSISRLYKYYYSNRWPAGAVIDPKFLFKICKFKGSIIIELEIWDHGIVYELLSYRKGYINEDPRVK